MVCLCVLWAAEPATRAGSLIEHDHLDTPRGAEPAAYAAPLERPRLFARG